MSKHIRIKEIEDSHWTYLQHLEELIMRLYWYHQELEMITLRLQLLGQNRELGDYSDDENWYSE